MKREHWTCDAGGDSVAVLNVPAALHRSRTFDIDVSLEVKVAATELHPWHELVFEIDGKGDQATATEWRIGLPPQVDYVEGCS